MKFVSTLAVLGLVSSLQAATIAVIDSGMDYKHEMIVPNLWVNASPVNKGVYQNVIHGWNFVEKNNQVIDYKYLGTFSPDVRKLMELQNKSFLFSITDEERAWGIEKQKDKEFMRQLNIFGNFIHGTHVAGIAVKNSRNKAMGVKLLATEVKAELPGIKSTDNWTVLEAMFVTASKTRMRSLGEVASFVAAHGAEIANCSFGTGIYQAAPLANLYFNTVFKRRATDDELMRATVLFLRVLNREGTAFVGAAPDTLFVFAAGNDGLSNDSIPASPASIKADNAISVAATYEDAFFAPFSNHGVGSVDVAAPGMFIESAIPGNEYMGVSGTSQAAPFVANVAGQIKDANPKLKPAQIRKILMETVDKKSWLANRVASGGMVNRVRAVRAARLSVVVPLDEAIERANNQVNSPKSMARPAQLPVDVMPLPMPSMFNI
jgi:cell wall-associated protease